MATAINQIQYAQTLLANRGPGAHRAVDKAVILTVNHFVAAAAATNLPANNDSLDKQQTVYDQLSLVATSGYAARQWGAMAGNGVSLVFVGETHGNITDVARANGFVAALAPTLPTLVITERGLAYPAVGVPANSQANETTLTTMPPPPYAGGLIPAYNFGLGFSAKERNWAIAGYIIACLATGPQNAQDRVLIFFGENHHQIWANFELLTKCTDALHLQRRPREYITIRSNNPAGFSTAKQKL